MPQTFGWAQRKTRPGPPTPPALLRSRTTLSPASPRPPVYSHPTGREWVRDHADRRTAPCSAETRASRRVGANLIIIHYNGVMGMKVYRAGRRSVDGKRRGRILRPLLLILLVLFALVLVYLIVPFGGQRVVLLGSDARAAEASRSDTIVITKAGGGMLAVPRDTLVDIPGVGEDKINAAFASGGPELTVETLENLTGVRMNDYVIVHFGGVEEIVDALGGITLEVDKPIRVGIDGRRVY